MKLPAVLVHITEQLFGPSLHSSISGEENTCKHVYVGMWCYIHVGTTVNKLLWV